MRGSIVFTALIGFFACSSASAEGMSLRWTACHADGGTSNMAFACNTNAGSRAIVPSFVLGSSIAQVTELTGNIDIVPASGALPAWWNFKTCRPGSLFYGGISIGAVECGTLSFCQSGIASIQTGIPYSNSERIQFTRRTCLNNPGPAVDAGLEYVAAVLQLNFTRTLGSPSCPGCEVGLCIVFNDLTVWSGPNGIQLVYPETPGGNIVTWQSQGSPCQTPVSTRRETWGAIKSLYR